jgi:cobyrinic acid a,c-diamide synthase
VLVLDVGGQSASAAAVARGFAMHWPDLALAGFILNRVGSPRHHETVAAAIAAAVPQVPILGAIARDAALALPSRHLGLVQAREHAALEAQLDRAAAIVGDAVDMARLVALARPARAAAPSQPATLLPSLGQHIAVARDDAFAFLYPSVLDAWRQGGSDISFFAPLADEAPDAGADAIYLPGGYPELHAGKLAANAAFRAGMARGVASGVALYGECGGYMALGEGLVDAAGERHQMLGLLPLVTSFAERRLHLGYREGALIEAGPLGQAGAAFRGHEFHYATIVSEGPGEALFRLRDSRGTDLGPAGRRRGGVMGSFFHLVDRAEAEGVISGARGG